MSFLDQAIAYLSPEKALQRGRAKKQLELLSTLYRGAEQSRLLADWILGKSDSTPDSWELSTLRERSRDLNRNDPVASGATETMSTNIVGQGLKPQSRLRAEVLGISDDQAAFLQKQAESVFEKWAPYADSSNRLSFDEIQFLSLRKIIEDGEIFALPGWAEESWRPFGRVIELAESERCCSTSMDYDQGIKLGDRGQPLVYSFSKPKSKNSYDINYTEIAAFDSKGRPKVLHIFPSKRVGQLRGIPFFAPAIGFFKHLTDYIEAEVVAARVAACLAVFVTQADPYQGLSTRQTATDPSGRRIQELAPGMVEYLGIGESINVVDPKRPGEGFAPFLEGILRLVGVSLGLPYELILKDFSKTNYSSARAALLEGRRHFQGWRSWFAQKFCQPIWELVLEEACYRNAFDVTPDEFQKMKTEYCRCSWIGGAWGWVDPVKEVESSKKAMDYGLSTLAEECAGQGRDWEEVLEQRAREQQKAGELGLSLSQAAETKPVQNEDDTDEETDNEQD
jgi:lambda family phage portal protein